MVDTRALIREEDWDLLMGDLEQGRPVFVLDRMTDRTQSFARISVRHAQGHAVRGTTRVSSRA